MGSALGKLAHSYLGQEAGAYFLDYDKRKFLYALDAALEYHGLLDTIERLEAENKALRHALWLAQGFHKPNSGGR